MSNPDAVAIFIPSMNRAHKLPGLIANIHAVTPEPHKIYFMVNDDDITSQKVLTNLKETFWVDPEGQDRRFCTRIQFLYQYTTEPWFVTGADDILFHANWLSNARKAIQPQHHVVAFNDLSKPDGTNFMIRREYIETLGGVVDMPPGNIYHPGYHHNYSDNELTETAMQRDAFLIVEDAVVEHLHWSNGKSEYDETYDSAQLTYEQDRKFFESRYHLWRKH